MDHSPFPASPIRRQPLQSKEAEPVAIVSEKTVGRGEWIIDNLLIPIIALASLILYVNGQSYVLEQITQWHVVPWYVSFILTIFEIVGFVFCREKTGKKRRKSRRSYGK